VRQQPSNDEQPKQGICTWQRPFEEPQPDGSRRRRRHEVATREVSGWGSQSDTTSASANWPIRWPLYVWLSGPRMRETSVDQVSIMALNDSSSYASSTPGLLPGRALMSYSTVTVHRLSACSVQRMCTVPA
jgi:hypothetical protein